MNPRFSVGALTWRLLRALAVVSATALAAGVPAAFGSFPGANGRIAFVSDRGGDPDAPDVWTMRPNGTDQVNLTAEPGWDIGPTWRADGKKIAFASNRMTAANPTGDFEIFVMNADGSNVRQVTFNLNDDGRPAWSPDGGMLVIEHQMFSPAEEATGLSNHDVWRMRSDGSHQQDLTPDPSDEQQADWSPDGAKIAFTTTAPDGDSAVYKMKPDGSHKRRLTDSGLDAGPSWSPDSRRLAFFSERDGAGNAEVYVMSADGHGQTRLTFEPAGDALPAWSPDGRKLLFATDRNATDVNPDNFDIYTMRADGSRQVNRTDNPALDIEADWQPLRDRDR
jgi:TolB protein